MCRKLSIFLLVLLLASASVWAFPGRQTGLQEAEVIAISVPEASAEQLKIDSGTPDGSISAEPEASSAVLKAAGMQRHGFYVLPVRPPTVPEGTSRLRLSLTAALPEAEVVRMGELIVRNE